MKIAEAQADQLDIVRELFREYQDHVNEAMCFEGFEEELSLLPGSYSEPKGIIYLVFDDADAIGCVAIKAQDDDETKAEIKRLYVRQTQRSKGAGKALLNNVFLFAKSRGYSSLFLETTASMQAAKSLYKKYGFKPINQDKQGIDSGIECYQYVFEEDGESH